MFLLDKNVNYIVWGTGLQAAKFSYAMRGKINIEFYVDNAVDEKSNWYFFGKKVYNFREAVHRFAHMFIIVAITEKSYRKIREQLLRENIEEYREFLWYQYFDKKTAVFHGNCHMDVIKKYLSSSEVFNKQYVIALNPAVCCNEKGFIDDSLLEKCDLFIHQDIRPDNPVSYKLSDEYILPRLSKFCIQITVPNLFGLGRGFFPQMNGEWKEDAFNLAISGGKDHNGLFPHWDCVIDKKVRQGRRYSEILSVFGEEVFARKDIVDNFWTYMDKIRKREEKWDIAIYDFIKSHYKQDKLFYDDGHPTNIIMKEISLGILKKLDLEDEHISCDYQMDGYEEFVYDVVGEALELEWRDIKVRKGISGIKLAEEMTREEYIKECLFWRYGIEE